MSGVHASCVEEWIRRHRRSARDDAPPRCSVCHQPYQGAGWVGLEGGFGGKWLGFLLGWVNENGRLKELMLFK